MCNRSRRSPEIIMKQWWKIVGVIAFGAIGICELLLWTFSITDLEDTPWYNCINNLGVALWLNYFIAVAMFICLWRKGDKR